MKNIYNEINHCQINNIADYLKTQKYTLNKQRGETIIKYVKQNQLKEKYAKKEHELLGLYQTFMETLPTQTKVGVENSLSSVEYMRFELNNQIKQLEEELK